METKQTAVEWLVKQVKLGDKSFGEFFKGEIQQAKEMEKEQNIEFANKVLYNAECSFTGRAYLEKDINKLYNETYGNEANS